MVINRLLTTVNYTKGTNKKNKYIVVHYVGATGGAEANCKYFQKVNRGASAHYFVGHSGEIWQCVEDKDNAWHCGAKTYKHNDCRNSNSIGVELCCKKDAAGNWYFTQSTLDAAVELIRDLMAKYGIPVTNVIRHYDVTGKQCPLPFVKSGSEWNSFRNRLAGQAVSNSSIEKTNKTDISPYLVKITANSLNVRKGAGTNYGVATSVKKNQVFTIVEEKMNGKTKWGKLKSGVGWISLSYTKKV